MAFDLTDPIFNNEDAARAYFESIRWPDGKPVCPHCGVVGQATLVKGKSHRPGMYQCNACREPFSVTVGSVMESSHIPLHKWALAFRLMAASKKGVSAHQLMRMLGLGSYRTAWFMAHRVREAMADSASPIRPSSTVSAGRRSVSVKVEDLTQATLKEVIGRTVVLDSTLNTDEAQHYKALGRNFADHQAVNHGSGEYARGETTTNTVEGFFGIFKRGMLGVYQHCGESHLPAYLGEFDFRYFEPRWNGR